MTATEGSSNLPLYLQDKERIQQAIDLERNKDYDGASEIYSQILEERAGKYGERSYECGDIAFKYATALLRSAQARGDELIAMRVNRAEKGRPSSPSETNEAQEGEEQEEEPQESVEEVLELAATTFDLAVTIFKDQLQKSASESDAKHWSKMAADCHAGLAEVVSEFDQFTVAEAEYNKALELVKHDLQVSSEYYCSLASTCVFTGNLTSAISNFEKAADCLERHKATKEQQIASYENIIKDIKQRIEELKEEMQTSQVKVTVPQSNVQHSFEKPSNPSGPVNVLVPRRKNQEQPKSARRGAVPRKNKQIDKCQKQCHRR
jgi:tetratricopeptide (TPR) repeat protein